MAVVSMFIHGSSFWFLFDDEWFLNKLKFVKIETLETVRRETTRRKADFNQPILRENITRFSGLKAVTVPVAVLYLCSY